MVEDILIRAQAKVVKRSNNGYSESVVEVTAGEFQEILVEIIRLRSKLEELCEMSPQFLSVKRLQTLAREGILPDD